MDERTQSADRSSWAAGNSGRVAALARELVALSPQLVVAHTTPNVVALHQATDTIPIVFVQVSDPVGAGFVDNLARPGGNITGFTSFEPSMAGKWLEVLRELAPRISRAAILFNPETAYFVARYYQPSFEAARIRSRDKPARKSSEKCYRN